MSSKSYQQHLTPANLRMLDRVLDTAGVADIDTEWHLDRRMSAGRFLVASFQEGTTSEAQLATNLMESFEVVHASCFPHQQKHADRDAIARWENEGGSPRRYGGRGAYLYGKRVETDGTWTIHHVFSGVPALYGTWDMVGLSKSVAERALRTINTPSSQSSV